MAWHKFLCPKCQKEVSVPRQAIGKQGKCLCGGVVLVPTPEQDTAFRRLLEQKRQAEFEERRRQAETEQRRKDEERIRQKQARAREADERRQQQEAARARQEAERAQRAVQAEERRRDDGRRYLAALKSSSIDLQWTYSAPRGREPASKKRESEMLHSSLIRSLASNG